MLMQKCDGSQSTSTWIQASSVANEAIGRGVGGNASKIHLAFDSR